MAPRPGLVVRLQIQFQLRFLPFCPRKTTDAHRCGVQMLRQQLQEDAESNEWLSQLINGGVPA
eukprot:746036-Prorocentrum_minimum.AAC.3